jgi:hypothetical protein
MFAGLIAGRATVHDGPAAGRYYVVAGVDRVRELIAIPHKYPVDMAPKYRSDDITVMKPVVAKPVDLTIEPGAGAGAPGLGGLIPGFGGASGSGGTPASGGGQ